MTGYKKTCFQNLLKIEKMHKINLKRSSKIKSQQT